MCTTWYLEKTETENKDVIRSVIQENDLNMAKEFFSSLKQLSNLFPFILKDKINYHDLGLITLYIDDCNEIFMYGFNELSTNKNEYVWLNKDEWYPYRSKYSKLWSK